MLYLRPKPNGDPKPFRLFNYWRHCAGFQGLLVSSRTVGVLIFRDPLSSRW